MTVLLVALVLGVAYVYSAGIRQRVYYEKAFFDYQKQFNLVFSSADEHMFRLQNFINSLDEIDTHNALKSNYKLGLNKFAILSVEEFKQQYLNELPERVSNTPVRTYTNDAPDDIDWTTKEGVVSAVKDQGSCGSCWAFSAVESIESLLFLKKGKIAELSPQQLVDCDVKNSGCNGGLRDVAMEYVMANGLCSETDYPYHARGETCRASSCTPVTKLTGHHTIPASEIELKKVVAIQPPSVGFAANYIMYYKSGIYDGKCDTAINHGVQAVGYGEEKGIKYWKIRNSWGSSWGEEGYFRIIRTEEAEPGLCMTAGRVHIPELEN